MPVSFFSYDIFIISVWFLVINGIYVAVHFYSEWRTSESKRVEENKIKKGGLNVKSGKQELFLNYGDIAGFNVDGDYILCYTIDNKKFLLDQSMDKLEKFLPTSAFFRLNRQTLIHRQIVTGFEKDVNGKLNILIKSHSPISSPLNVSRTRASSFQDLVSIRINRHLRGKYATAQRNCIHSCRSSFLRSPFLCKKV